MITCLNDYKSYLIQDRIALGYSERMTFVQKVKLFLWPDKTYQFEKALRKYEYLHNCRKKSLFWLIRYVYAKYRHRKLSLQLGFTIGPNIFGPGLSIPHYGTIVINPNVRVGSNCRLHVGVNIGASGGAEKVPTIGDNVYIGPGAILFGDIKIGNNVMIGANSTVTKSFEEDHIVIAGSPAKIIRRNEHNSSN